MQILTFSVRNWSTLTNQPTTWWPLTYSLQTLTFTHPFNSDRHSNIQNILPKNPLKNYYQHHNKLTCFKLSNWIQWKVTTENLPQPQNPLYPHNPLETEMMPGSVRDPFSRGLSQNIPDPCSYHGYLLEQ